MAEGVDVEKVFTKIPEFLLHALPLHPKDIIPITMEKFDVCKQAVSYHLQRLIKKGLIVSEGKTTNKRFKLYSKKCKLNKNLEPTVQRFAKQPEIKDNVYTTDHFMMGGTYNG